ncbi:MAG: CinA family protein, partial [Clostridia bacterium]|nr:CinA family protein [Clostridia bacterium]
ERLSAFKGSLAGEYTEIADFIYQNAENTLFLLPNGEEDCFILERVLPYLDGLLGVKKIRRTVRFVHNDSELVKRLVSAVRGTFGEKIYLDYGVRANDYTLYLSAENAMLAEDAIRLLLQGLGDSVYALDGTSLEMRLIELLRLRGQKISVAESFTGGGVGRRIVSVAGASDVYFEGLNTYSEKAKRLRLGVSEVTLGAHGAASDKTAYEMALGVLSSGQCDIAIATTGVAGPKPERADIPVGLCFISVGTRERVYVYRFEFSGDRDEITEKGITHALFLACRRLKDL